MILSCPLMTLCKSVVHEDAVKPPFSAPDKVSLVAFRLIEAENDRRHER